MAINFGKCRIVFSSLEAMRESQRDTKIKVADLAGFCVALVRFVLYDRSAF